MRTSIAQALPAVVLVVIVVVVVAVLEVISLPVLISAEKWIHPPL